MKKIIALSLFVILFAANCKGGNFGSTQFHPSETIQSVSKSPSSPPQTTILATKASISVTFTPTFYVTPSPTFLPTVPNDQRENVILKLLQTNGSCSGNNPCFWGFTPFISSADQMNNYFLSFGNRTGKQSFIFPYKERVWISVEYDSNNGYLSDLKVTFNGLDWPDISNKDWDAFSLDKIIQKYGEPNSIKFGASVLEGGNHYQLYFYLIYNNLKFSIEYASSVFTKFSTFCPLQENWTQNVIWSFGTNYFQAGGYKELTEVTGLSINEFTNLMQRIPNEACFKVATDVLFP